MGKILYHFTRPAYVDDIMKGGIAYGDVPVTPSGGFNAPWLTDDPAPTIQQWIQGTDKNKVRITVDIKNDKNLRKWDSYARNIHIEDWWYKALDFSGGGGSEHWYIFLGRIPPQWITDVEYLQ